jgi:flavodoxin
VTLKTLTIYYSATGKSASLAKALSEKFGYDLYEIKPQKKLSKVNMYVKGCLDAMRAKGLPIEENDLPNVSNYEELVLLSPVWAGSPPPYVYEFFNKEDVAGLKIHVIFSCMGGAGSSEKKIRKLFEMKQAEVKRVDYNYTTKPYDEGVAVTRISRLIEGKNDI